MTRLKFMITSVILGAVIPADLLNHLLSLARGNKRSLQRELTTAIEVHVHLACGDSPPAIRH